MSEDGNDELTCQILSACRLFISETRAKPDADALEIIKELPGISKAVSDEVLARLRRCHLDGTLYQQAPHCLALWHDSGASSALASSLHSAAMRPPCCLEAAPLSCHTGGRVVGGRVVGEVG